MRARVFLALSIAVSLAAGRAVFAQRSASLPDLQGTWNGSTLTPLQRPQPFRDRSAFTPEEAAEYVRASPDRIRSRLPTAADRQMQIDIDDTFVEVENMPLDGLRTSLIIDPANGMLPPLLPVAMIDMTSANNPLPVPASGASIRAMGMLPAIAGRMIGDKSKARAFAREAWSANGNSPIPLSIVSSAHFRSASVGSESIAGMRSPSSGR
jgi:hypothetical protein